MNEQPLPDTWLCSILRYGPDFNLKDIECYIELDSSCVNKQDRDGRTPLYYAVVNQRFKVDIIQLLLRYGADVNFKECNDRPLLHIAVEFQRDESVISLLLEHGANVLDLLDYQSAVCIALHNEASKGVVQLLLDAGCPLNGCEEHDSALHCAVNDPFPTLKEDVFHLLIERGADVNAINRFGRSVMCHSLYRCIDIPSIEIVLAAGVLLSTCTKHASPLLCATDFPSVLYDVRNWFTTNHINFLLRKGTPLDKVDTDGLTALQCALKGRYYETDAIRLLLHHTKDVSVVDSSNNNLLDLALQNRERCDLRVVKLLIKLGIRADNVNARGQTALHWAADNDHCCKYTMKLLLKNGAAVNAKNEHGKTPLDLTVTFCPFNITVNIHCNMKKIRVLLAAGAQCGVTSRQSLLKIILDHCYHQELGVFQIVLKYSLLQNSDLDMEGLIEGYKKFGSLSKYWGDCVDELLKIESTSVGEGCTLREFLNEYSSPGNVATNRKPLLSNYDIDQLLRIKVNNVFPLFSDIIYDKVDRRIMNAKLPEIWVYTIKYTPHEAYQEEKIFLDFATVCEIFQYLKNEDLFGFIVSIYEDTTGEKGLIPTRSTESQNY